MTSNENFSNWMLGASLLPPALVIVLLLCSSFLPGDLLVLMIVLCWWITLLVGCSVLIINFVLILKRVASLLQLRVVISMVLAAIEAVVSIGIPVILLRAFKNFRMWP